MNPPFAHLLTQALERRRDFVGQLHTEGTDAYRLFHGAAEGWPGLTIDRYGSLVLMQTFRDALPEQELAAVEAELRAQLPFFLDFAYNHRGKSATQSFDLWHRPSPEALVEHECQEFGARFKIRARHQGIDPWLFLDLRSGRRELRQWLRSSPGLSVLNLFSYTCSVGVGAAAAGAREVWNIDFAASSLAVGQANAELNGIKVAEQDGFRTIEEDCLPVMRQLAGLPAGGRNPRKLNFKKFEARQFDVVVLDPPAWAKGKFGAIDVAGDYPTLFKPAVLIAKAGGGRVIATNHVASIEVEAWFDVLTRCAAKAGKPIRSLRLLTPEADFPSFDGRHPLKIAVCEF